MKKRLLAILMVLAMSVTIFASCSAPAESEAPAEETPAESEAPAEEEETTDDLAGSEIILMASQNWIKEVDEALIASFEEETGIVVKTNLVPDNEYTTLLGTTLAGGSDAVDVFMYGAGADIVSQGIVDVAVDLSNEEWVSRQADWTQVVNSVDGKQLGFSTWSIDYEGVLYNKTYFEENSLEVPTTWDDFIALCDQILDLGITPLYEGINGTWHTTSWIFGLTPKLLEEKPDLAEYLNSGSENGWADITAFADGLGQIEQLLSAKAADGSPLYYTNDGQAEDWFGSYPALQNREVAMMFTYTAYANELAANGATDEFGMFPVPLLDNQTPIHNGGGISRFINVNSENIDAAKAYFNFLAEDENLETYYAARADLVNAAFNDVESAVPTSATTDILERSDVAQADIPAMFQKNVLYWDPDMYKYLQGMADGSTSVEDIVASVDSFRTTMFDTAG